MPSIPASIDDVTNEWMSEILGTEVTGFEVTFLEGGVLSDAFKVHDIGYGAPAGDLPDSVVMKLTNAVPERRAVAAQNGAYVREVRFFKELADEVPLKTPEIYALLDDGSDTFEYFCIVMEDLTTHSEVFDQVIDPPDEEWTRKINLEVAGLHAAYWESDALELDWLKQPDHRFRHAMHDTALGCPEAIDTFVGLWERAFGKSPYQDAWASVKPLTEMITGPRCKQILEAVNHHYSNRPWTLVHNDLRADNIFRTRGSDAATGELTYIDWQLMSAGPVGPEFTQSWQHSLPPEVRRKDLDFLKQYHERLVQLQPAAAAYTYDMLVEDYRLAYIMWWMVLITLGAATFPIFFEPEGERMKRLWGQGLSYMMQAMDDHGCLDLANRLVADVR
jgi:hypothetical protein